MSETASSSRPAREGLRWSAWNLLLLVPLLMLVTPWFNTRNRACSACRSSTGSSSPSCRSASSASLLVYVMTKDEPDHRGRRPGARRRLAGRGDLAMIQWPELIVFTVLFLGVTVMGFLAARWQRGATPRPPRRVGPRRPQVRLVDHLVPRRRRPLHGVHVRRGAGAAVRRRRDGLLRPALHGDPLPDRVPAGAAAVVGLAGARLRHPRRLRARPLRLADAGAARRDHRPRRDHALHRAAARRPGGGAAHDGPQRRRLRRPPAAADRVRDPGALHLPVRPAGARADRVRQGHPDLHGHPGGGDLPARQARRLGGDLRRGRREDATPTRPPAPPPARSC